MLWFYENVSILHATFFDIHKDKDKNKRCHTAIPMTFLSRDIYFHMPSGNQTTLGPVEKYWLESFIMSVPSPFLINSFTSFLLITYQVFWS